MRAGAILKQMNDKFAAVFFLFLLTHATPANEIKAMIGMKNPCYLKF